jgi:hypothetical protein
VDQTADHCNPASRRRIRAPARQPNSLFELERGLLLQHYLAAHRHMLGGGQRIQRPPGQHVEHMNLWVANQEAVCRPAGDRHLDY